MESFRNDISDNLNVTISGNQMTESIGKLLSVMETICRREGLHFFAFGDLLVVFCKCKFLKFADKNGEFCISVLEKVAGCPAGLPDAS